MQNGYSQEEEVMNRRATEVIRHLTDELHTRTNELAKLREKLADRTAFANRMTTQLVATVMSRDERIRELEQKYEDACAFTRYLESEQDYHVTEMRKLTSTIVQLECRMECRQRKFKQQVEEKQEQLNKEKAACRNLMDQMEKLKESMQTEKLESLQNSSKEIEALRKELEEKEEALQSAEDLNRAHNVKELASNQELQDGRNESIDLKESMQTEKLDCLQNSSKEIEALREELEEKEEALQCAEDLNRALIVKELASNQELQEARKESINGLQEVASHHHHRSIIGIKRMGEIDHKAFQEACLHKFANEELEDVPAKLCSLWEQHLQDPHWHPFKINQCNEGHQQEVIDEDDEKLKQLRNEYGEVVYGSVTTALLELNEYNPSGRYPVLEVWNFRERRRAMVKDVIHYLINQLKTHKRKRK